MTESWGERIPVYLTREEAHAIIDQVPTARERLLVELLWRTAARVSEALMLRPADVGDGVVELANLKQRRKRNGVYEHYVGRKRVLVDSDFTGRLRAWAAANLIGPLEPIFAMHRSTAWRIVKRAAIASGVLKVHGNRLVAAWPHTFRHGAAVNLLLQERAWPLTAIQRQLGHARIETTTIYTRISGADLRELVEATKY